MDNKDQGRPATAGKSQTSNRSRIPDINLEHIESRNVVLNDSNIDEHGGGAMLHTIKDYIPDQGPDHKPSQPKTRLCSPINDVNAASHTTIPRPSIIKCQNTKKPNSNELPPITMRPLNYQPQCRNKKAPVVQVCQRKPVPPRRCHQSPRSDGIKTDETSGGMTSDDLANYKDGEEEDGTWTDSDGHAIKQKLSEDSIKSSGSEPSGKLKAATKLKSSETGELSRKSTKSGSGSRKESVVSKPVTRRTSDLVDNRPFPGRRIREQYVALSDDSILSEVEEEGSSSSSSGSSTEGEKLRMVDNRPVYQRIRERYVALSAESFHSERESSSGSSSGSTDEDEDEVEVEDQVKFADEVKGEDDEESNSSSGSSVESEIEVMETYDANANANMAPNIELTDKAKAKKSYHHRQEGKHGGYLVRAWPNNLTELTHVKSKHYHVPGTRFSVGTIFPNAKPLHIVPASEDIERGKRDFIFSNVMKVRRIPAKIPIPRYVDDVKGRTHLLAPSGLARNYVYKPDYGRVPMYIKKRMKEIEQEMRAEARQAGLAKGKGQGDATQAQPKEPDEDCYNELEWSAYKNCENYHPPEDDLDFEYEDDAQCNCKGNFSNQPGEDYGIDLDALEPLENQHPDNGQDDLSIDLDELEPLEEQVYFVGEFFSPDYS